MRFRITCDVKSKCILPPSVEIRDDQKEFRFMADEEGHFVQLIAEAPVKDYKNYSLPLTTMGIGYPRFEIDLFEELIADIQYIESVLGFVASLSYIDWQEPTLEAISESENENLHAYKRKLSARFVDSRIKLQEEDLIDIVQKKRILKHLTIPYAFWREGKNEYMSGKFIVAFYNFYFVLEALYGEGKKNPEVERRMKESVEFAEAVRRAEPILRRDVPQVVDTVLKELVIRHKTFCAVDLADHFVHIRNALHHFSPKAKQNQGTPLTNADFFDVATVIMMVAAEAINVEVDKT